MYHWMVYIHVLATFAFLLTHGVSSVVALRLRRQRDPAPAEEVEALLSSAPAITLAAIGFGGIAVILWLMMFKPF